MIPVIFITADGLQATGFVHALKPNFHRPIYKYKSSAHVELDFRATSVAAIRAYEWNGSQDNPIYREVFE